jgi:hypothetical protein
MSSSLPQPAERDGDWLAGSRGFQVDSPHGPFGVVDDVRYDQASGRPDALVVRAGRFGVHRFVVPVDEIAGVLPSKRLVVLQELPSLAARSA